MSIKFNGVVLAGIIFHSSAMAETPSLEGYLESMDLTEISFSGYIKYEKSGLSNVDFTYYNADGKPFAVTIDAGRTTRELIESECENSSFMAGLKDFCKISGTGTVEIRGSSINISIDDVSSLEKP